MGDEDTSLARRGVEEDVLEDRFSDVSVEGRQGILYITRIVNRAKM